MQATEEDVAYQMRKLWVDKSRYIPLKEELYAKSGKLLKKTELTDINNMVHAGIRERSPLRIC